MAPKIVLMDFLVNCQIRTKQHSTLEVKSVVINVNKTWYVETRRTVHKD